MPKSKVRKKHPQRTSSLSVERRAYQEQPSRHGFRTGGRSALGASADFDNWVTAIWTLRWTLVAVGISICGTVILAFVLGAVERDARAYANAPVCAAGASVGCQMEIPVTIQDHGEGGSSRDPIYYLDLSGAAPADGQIDLPGQTTLWYSATAGDSATAIVWNGAVVRIEDDGIEGDTIQAPGIHVVLVQGLLISGVVWIITSVLFAARIAAWSQSVDSGWARALPPLQMPAFLATIFFPFGALIGQTHESLNESVATGGGLTAFAAVWVAVSWLRHR